MDEHNRQDDLCVEWLDCGALFEKCLKEFDDFYAVDNCEFINSSQIEAGKLFLKTGKRVKYPFELSSDYLIAPESKSKTDTLTYYAEYWLCVLDLFVYNCSQFFDSQRLPRYELPYDNKDRVCWDLLAHDETIQNQFVLEPPITYWIIEASIKACGFIAKLRNHQIFKIDKQSRTISHKGYSISCRSKHAWKLISILYESNGAPVKYKYIIKQLWDIDAEESKQQYTLSTRNLHRTVYDIREYFKENNLNSIADAIKSHPRESYMLDFSSL